MGVVPVVKEGAHLVVILDVLQIARVFVLQDVHLHVSVHVTIHVKQHAQVLAQQLALGVALIV